MKLVPDTTRLFARQTHYERSELDNICEEVMRDFLFDRYGMYEMPIVTDDLTRLIEQYADDFDSAADLSGLDGDVEGVTDFFYDRKPCVSISAHLWAGPARENRLRTTLAHEFAHVHLHNYFYQEQQIPELFRTERCGAPLRCTRQTIEGTSPNWIEWQAGYASGALLMPISRLRIVVSTYFEVRKLHSPLTFTSANGSRLIEEVACAFQVSRDAARVRLSQLGYVFTEASTPLSLGLF